MHAARRRATASVTSFFRKPQLRSIPYESATPTAGPPGARYVEALLVGPQAVAGRLGGRLGEWLAFWTRVLQGGTEPTRIPVDLLTDLGSHITVARSRTELGAHRNEDRAREYLIGRIPGGRREGE